MIRSISRTERRLASAAALSLLSLVSGALHAQPAAPARDPAASDVLFRSARTLLKSGDWAAACPKFEASFELDPAAPILLNVARCHEHQGKLAAALSDYERALLLNRGTVGAERQRELETLAREGAAAIAPRVPQLRLVVKWPPPELSVTRDGTRLPLAALGELLPVDPGAHEIVVSAPGHVPERRTVMIAEGTKTEIEIELVSEASLLTAAGHAEPPAPSPPAREGVPTWAWVSGGLGVAFGAVAVGLAVDAAAAKSTIHQHCPADAQGIPVCDATLSAAQVSALNGRKDRGFPLAYAFGAAGVLGVGAAIVGIATAPSRRTATPTAWVEPGGAGVGVKGCF